MAIRHFSRKSASGGSLGYTIADCWAKKYNASAIRNAVLVSNKFTPSLGAVLLVLLLVPQAALAQVNNCPVEPSAGGVSEMVC
jgi:hypothetical protein